MQTPTVPKIRRSPRLAAKAKAAAAAEPKAAGGAGAKAEPKAEPKAAVPEALASWMKIQAACNAALATVEAQKKEEVKKMDPVYVQKQLDDAWTWYLEIRNSYVIASIKGTEENIRYLKNKTDEAYTYLQEWIRIYEMMGIEEMEEALEEAWSAELDKDDEE